MDHEEAVRLQVAEKHVLGMSPEILCEAYADAPREMFKEGARR